MLLSKINIYKGCLLLLSTIYKNYQSLIQINDDKYPLIIVLEVISYLANNNSKDNHKLLVYNKEEMLLLSTVVSVKHKQMRIEEWKLVLDIINTMTDIQLLLQK